MRKALLPMIASLALCGAATAAMVASSAEAQPETHNPMMMTPVADTQLAQNDAGPRNGPPPRDLRRRDTGDMAARMKQMCQDQVARETGQLAYLQTRLQLTPAQQSAFQHWQQVKLTIAHRQADNCAQRPAPQRTQDQVRTRPSPSDVMGREEDQLKQRLADIQAERPAMEALYNALSPEQRTQLVRGDRPERHMFADARGQRGRMGPPPDAR